MLQHVESPVASIAKDTLPESMNRSSFHHLRPFALGCRFFLKSTIGRHAYRFLAFLFILQSSFLQAQVVVTLGTGKITGSVTGVNSGNASVSGLPAGIGFDLIVTASSNSTPTMSVSNHPDGIGVVGGSNVEIDNRNNLDANDDESLTFTLANVTGLNGQSLKISGIVTRSLGSTQKQYALSSGTSGSFNTSPFTIAVPDLTSITITATGPTTSPAVDSRFIIHQLQLTLSGSSGGGGGDGGGNNTGGTNAVATVKHSGVDDSGHPFISFDSVAGESYEIQCSTDLLTWTPLVTRSGNGSVISFTDEFVQAPGEAKKFYRVQTVQTPNGNLTNTTLSIRQTWFQQTSGYTRTAVVQVPTGAGPHPVVILLHGNGGTGAGTIGALNPHLNNAIRVAPDGYEKSWNVDAEVSKAPDVAFIRDLITLLKSYDNVDAGKISLFGNSNGAGMTNRLIIELDGAAFQNAGTQVSQMINKMHNNGSFWYNSSGTNDYNQMIMPAKRRRIININGTLDPTVPYSGGSGVGTSFLHSQESIYRFAQAMGETRNQYSDAEGIAGTGANGYSAALVKYSYRNDQVVHYKVNGGDHGLRVGGSTVYADEAKQIIANFLLQ